MLRMKTAKLYAKVEFVRENNKIVEYVISSLSIILCNCQRIKGDRLDGYQTR
jgi:hypothetical protein